jgi:uncharacterized protein (TIGR02246 family)
MKNVIIILTVLVLGCITYTFVNELNFSKAFEKRMAERIERGPIIYANPTEDHTSAIESLQTLYQSTLTAWCNGDGAVYGNAFTADAEYIAFTGEITRGRTEITASHQELFQKWLKDTCLVGTIESIRFPASDIAVIVALGGTTFDGKSVLKRPSIQTYVAQRHEAGWLFSNFQNSRVADGNVFQLIALGIRTSLFRM